MLMRVKGSNFDDLLASWKFVIAKRVCCRDEKRGIEEIIYIRIGFWKEEVATAGG